MGGRLQQAEAGQRDEGEHEEGAGAGAEQSVIEADQRHDGDAEQGGAHALGAVDVGEAGASTAK